jgi:hypothetical protein
MTRTHEELAELQSRASVACQLAARYLRLVREAAQRTETIRLQYEACMMTVEARRWRRTIESGRLLLNLPACTANQERAAGVPR